MLHSAWLKRTKNQIVTEQGEIVLEDGVPGNEAIEHEAPLESAERSGTVHAFPVAQLERRASEKEKPKILTPRGELHQAGVDIEAKNSPLDLVLVKRLRRSSMASTVERGLKTLRRTQTRLSSSGGRSSSSLRVPER